MRTGGKLLWRRACNALLKKRERQGRAQPVVKDKNTMASRLAADERNVPSDAKCYSMSFDEHRNQKIEEVEKAVQTVAMICV